MRRKDVVSFFGIWFYIIFVFCGLHMYFTTDECCAENRLACTQQNRIIDTIWMINYSETIHFQK